MTRVVNDPSQPYASQNPVYYHHVEAILWQLLSVSVTSWDYKLGKSPFLVFDFALRSSAQAHVSQ